MNTSDKWNALTDEQKNVFIAEQILKVEPQPLNDFIEGCDILRFAHITYQNWEGFGAIVEKLSENHCFEVHFNGTWFKKEGVRYYSFYDDDLDELNEGTNTRPADAAAIAYIKLHKLEDKLDEI